jgi:hypothetical protein
MPRWWKAATSACSSRMPEAFSGARLKALAGANQFTGM